MGRAATRRKKDIEAIAPGARVEIRDEEWLVRKCVMASHGGLAVHCVGLSELVRGKEAIFLSELDEIRELRPEETKLVPDPTSQYRRSRLYLEALLRNSPPTESEITIGHRAALDLTEYQLDPAHRALERPRARILMADGVGMGKTVEVGILLSELIRRGRGERILVVALKSILAQFQEELWARFTIPLVRLDSIGLQRVQRRIPASMNPFHYYDRCIISIDTLKKDTKYARYLEDCRWDVVVVDECQNVADRGSTTSQRARLAKLLANTCDSLIFTSATPHDGRPESFASLMNLLDPTAIADPTDYGREDIKGLFVRRFKKDVVAHAGKSFRERQVHDESVPATPQEEAVLARLETLDLRSSDRGRRSGTMLFTTTLKKAFLSSPDALVETIDERQAKLEAMIESPDSPPELVAAASHDQAELAALRAEAAAVQTQGGGAKLARFLALLDQHGTTPKKSSPRVVVFSERIATLDMLRARLLAERGFKEDQVAVFKGSLDDQTQTALVRDFGTESSAIKVLLCSDAAAEGLNLHYHCHRLVHFDIPWSLITLQQRNGRIDRYGQLEDPQIHYLLTIPTRADLQGDARILERLIEKEQYAHKNLGDAADLLNLHEAEKEEERIARAIEDKTAADEVIPDAPPSSEHDFLTRLFAEDVAAAQAEPAAPTRDPFRLVSDDLAFAREALAEIGEEGAIVPIPDMQGFELVELPPDLERRYAYLPAELDRKVEKARFTTDRELVKKALADSRKTPDTWPAWQLFWELHPFAGWLTDRVLASFARHEAPVIAVTSGLEPGERVILFQGLLSNRRSRPALVAWFGVSFLPGAAKPDGIREFEDIAAVTGLAGPKPLANRNSPFAAAALEALLPAAVERARGHMSELRESRGQKLLAWLKDETRRRAAWEQKTRAIFGAREAALAGKGGIPRKKLDEDRRAFQKLLDDHKEFTESLKTTDNPYLRVAAVFVREGIQ